MKRNLGFTLIEIMIALVLGLIIIGATLNIYIATIKGSSDTVKSARLNYDLDMVMQFMVNDIRRAGYWGGAITDADATLNPSNIDTALITITDATGVAGDNCILYSYDGDGSGFNTPTVQTDDIDTDEYYGFKLENSTIKIRFNVVDKTASETSCNKGSWENILDSDNIQVTTLAFTAANSKCLNTTTDEVFPGTCVGAFAAAAGVTGKVSVDDMVVENRQIDISLTGNVINDTTVEKTLTAIVKVRNNRIFVQ